jgi:hypothetical protein
MNEKILVGLEDYSRAIELVSKRGRWRSAATGLIAVAVGLMGGGAVQLSLGLSYSGLICVALAAFVGVGGIQAQRHALKLGRDALRVLDRAVEAGCIAEKAAEGRVHGT